MTLFFCIVDVLAGICIGAAVIVGTTILIIVLMRKRYVKTSYMLELVTRQINGFVHKSTSYLHDIYKPYVKEIPFGFLCTICVFTDLINILSTGKISMLFCRLMIFFSKSTFLKKSFRNTIRVLNSLDPDQVRCFVMLDLIPNVLQN